MNFVESEEWRTAISSDLASLQANETFKFVNSQVKTLISINMIVQKKLNMKGNIQHYKAWLVGHEFQ